MPGGQVISKYIYNRINENRCYVGPKRNNMGFNTLPMIFSFN